MISTDQTPFQLQPWTKFILGNVVGFKHASDGENLRRNLSILAGRGSGKSLFASCLIIYYIVRYAPFNSYSYVTSGTVDQATTSFDMMLANTINSPILGKFFKKAWKTTIRPQEIVYEPKQSRIKRISNASESASVVPGAQRSTNIGLNVFTAFIDETQSIRRKLSLKYCVVARKTIKIH